MPYEASNIKITVHGAGYVGLVTGICFAEIGHDVLIMDIDPDRIVQLIQGRLPIHEPGLAELLKNNLDNQRLKFTTDIVLAVHHGDYQFIAVGTPSDPQGRANLDYVKTVAKSIAMHMQSFKIIVNKSTAPVGTVDLLQDLIAAELHEQKRELNFEVISNPEFLREGCAVLDFMSPDRIIVGSNPPSMPDTLFEIYEPIVMDYKKQWIGMNARSAELTKYAANAMLATKISFMNELSYLAEALDADIEAVRHGIGTDSRIGSHFIAPGCGYGGSCFPKDIRALTTLAADHDIAMPLLNAVDAVNVRQKRVLFEKIQHYFHHDLNHKTIAVWGLAFKPGTDDVREASSLTLLNLLFEQGVKIQAYDPVAMAAIKQLYPDQKKLLLMPDALSAAQDADALVIVTEWSEFKTVDLEKLTTILKKPVIFDGRNLYKLSDLPVGLDYFPIGHRPILSHSSGNFNELLPTQN